MSSSLPPLSDYELLQVVLGNHAAEELRGKSLTELFQSEEVHSAYRLILLASREIVRRWLHEELEAAPVFSSPDLVREYLKTLFQGREAESFVVLFLNTQHRLIVAEELFQGTLAQTSVYPREVVKRGLALNAAAVIFAHNHPSGIPEPSQADESLTRVLQQALALVDVRVLDHIVVGGSKAVSLSERGLI